MLKSPVILVEALPISILVRLVNVNVLLSLPVTLSTSSTTIFFTSVIISKLTLTLLADASCIVRSLASYPIYRLLFEINSSCVNAINVSFV